MSARLCIDAYPSALADRPSVRWIIFVHEGSCCMPILSYRAEHGSSLGLDEFIAHCAKRGHVEVLERIHAKVCKGRSVWFNDEPVGADEVRQLLDLHDRDSD